MCVALSPCARSGSVRSTRGLRDATHAPCTAGPSSGLLRVFAEGTPCAGAGPADSGKSRHLCAFVSPRARWGCIPTRGRHTHAGLQGGELSSFRGRIADAAPPTPPHVLDAPSCAPFPVPHRVSTAAVTRWSPQPQGQSPPSLLLTPIQAVLARYSSVRISGTACRVPRGRPRVPCWAAPPAGDPLTLPAARGRLWDRAGTGSSSVWRSHGHRCRDPRGATRVPSAGGAEVRAAPVRQARRDARCPGLQRFRIRNHFPYPRQDLANSRGNEARDVFPG